jgi:hypothetical protein
VRHTVQLAATVQGRAPGCTFCYLYPSNPTGWGWQQLNMTFTRFQVIFAFNKFTF